MQYTDQVESFGLDECWLDVTGSTRLFGSGREIAEEIRQRIKDELGLTVSIGVSFNKIFAKLGRTDDLICHSCENKGIGRSRVRCIERNCFTDFAKLAAGYNGSVFIYDTDCSINCVLHLMDNTLE